MRQRAQRGDQGGRRSGDSPAGPLRTAGGARQAHPPTRQRWVVLGHGDSALCY
ncbi:MAG TPA: hypothetical protein VHW06_12805 [Streptosporangiaceae bacterium]|nr:hypothetical protein [Streptosporangiaceae bacterium]